MSRPWCGSSVLTDSATAYCERHGHAYRWRRTQIALGQVTCATCGHVLTECREHELADVVAAARAAAEERARERGEDAPAPSAAPCRRGRRPGVVDPGRTAEIVRLRGEGKPVRELATRFRVSVARIYQLLRQAKKEAQPA